MKKVQNKKHRIIIILLVLLVVLALFFIIRNRNSSSGSTDQDIRVKFACDRVTQDVRETDIFCNPEFYRDPDLSYDRYYTYMNCKNHQKKPSANEIAQDESAAKIYDVCTNKTKLNKERLKFNERLNMLKMAS